MAFHGAEHTTPRTGRALRLLTAMRYAQPYPGGRPERLEHLEVRPIASVACPSPRGTPCGTDGSPALTYAMFTDAHPDQNNYGGTHPVVQAHSVIGRVLFDSIATTVGM